MGSVLMDYFKYDADNKYVVRWNIVLASYMGAAMFS